MFVEKTEYFRDEKDIIEMFKHYPQVIKIHSGILYTSGFEFSFKEVRNKKYYTIQNKRT